MESNNLSLSHILKSVYDLDNCVWVVWGLRFLPATGGFTLKQHPEVSTPGSAWHGLTGQTRVKDTQLGEMCSTCFSYVQLAALLTFTK